MNQLGLVASRSLMRTLRQPFFIVPSLVFPLFLLAVNSSGLDAATKIPGFPADSYLDFALTVTFMQGALFAAITAGTTVAGDIENGFLNRLALTPLSGPAILVGQLAGAVAIALIGILTFITVGLIAGVSIAGGVLGCLLLIVLALLVAVAFAGIGTAIGVRTGRAEAVQGVFPLLFVTLFLSSSNLPRNLIQTDWFREIATYNPISYLVEGMRSLIITGWDWEALGQGFGWVLVIGAGAWWLAGREMRTRMART
ncbi:MAG: ABC transporter permease [Solirubrobacteraceae bacterium]